MFSFALWLKWLLFLSCVAELWQFVQGQWEGVRGQYCCGQDTEHRKRPYLALIPLVERADNRVMLKGNMISYFIN